MTDYTANPVSESSNALFRALKALWTGLVQLGETSSRAKALNALAEKSDAELEALGITRQDVLRRILGDIY